nr:hypothetical protein [Deltaproteobacteria bacterium]
MRALVEKFKALFKRGDDRKKKLGKRRRKRSSGYRSPEEFHADFENRYGRPGRVPEDVA